MPEVVCRQPGWSWQWVLVWARRYWKCRQRPNCGVGQARWLTYLGWQIAHASAKIDTDMQKERPLSAWLLALLFLLMAIPCMLLWAWLGIQAQERLNSPSQLRRFNQVMGLLLALSGWLGLLG